MSVGSGYPAKRPDREADHEAADCQTLIGGYARPARCGLAGGCDAGPCGCGCVGWHRVHGSGRARGPGTTSYLDLGRKDCLGTARNTGSKVWYTVAGGVLSDVYYPTTDNTNVKTVQYIVTDGRTFTDLQTRDMTYTVRPLDSTGMACQVTSTAKSGAYRLVTDYTTDPLRDSVVMHTTYCRSRRRPAGTTSTSATTRSSTAQAAAAPRNGGGGSATVNPATHRAGLL